jgi:protein SCO1/2
VQTVYVSVDPERDTPERMGAYLSHYSIPVVGLTGTPAEVDSVAGDFGVYHKKSDEPTAAGYLIDHSTMVYLIGPSGNLRFLFRNDHTVAVMAALVKKALG